MKKRILAILLCSVLLLLCGCNGSLMKYKRISFETETLGEELKSIDENTVVINKANETFSSQMPIYKIKERNISQQEFQKMLDNLEIADDPSYRYDDFELDGNRIYISLRDYTDVSRGFFDMTEDEVEDLAWEVFNKIPFMEGEYECVGIQNKYTYGDATGNHISRAGVGFCRLIDGVRAVGDETCVLYFDGTGLVEIRIKLYDYEKIGTMDMVSLEDAEGKIKTPDDFKIGKNGTVDTLQVNQVKLRLVNQYSRGCTILQPIYNFIGTATFEDGTQSEFSSRVIAIPESMTYEEE